MSRIGKKAIEIPTGVEVTISDGVFSAKGPKGELYWNIFGGVNVVKEGDEIILSINSPTKILRAMWGTSRALIANIVKGVSEGYEKKLEIRGVGYKAQIQGKNIFLNVGFSHSVEITPPEGVNLSVEKNVITISGIDKILVGETAAKIRAVRKPEPYKGKGIRYQGEVVRRKAGKKAVGAGSTA